MKWTNLRDAAEIIGIVAIVASLLFVGLQMRQSHEIALAEIYQARTAAVMEWNHTLATSELALSAFEKSASGRLDELMPLERRASTAMIQSALYAYENSYYQFTLGYLPEEHWTRIRTAIKTNMQDPVWREQMLASAWFLRPSFKQILDELAAETSSDRK